MNYKMIGRVIALCLAVEAFFMLPALILCLVDGDRSAAWGFLWTVAAVALTAGLLALLCRKGDQGLRAREGLVCVGACWIIMSLFGCLPFVISGAIPAFVDALFEIVSGFTTTGASILPQVESLARGLLYWRSFSHWLGGMGVLVFLLAVVPITSRRDGAAIHLLRAESPGPDVGKLVPRMRQTAMILYLLYVLLTVLNVVFLLLGRMPLFDAVCTAFGTAGTGGFGIKNDSIASYSPYIQNVCTVFMLLFGINFSCYYLILIGKLRRVAKDEELRLYLCLVLAAVVVIVLNLRGVYGSLGETVRYAFFQVASIVTTTGFATTDFDLWPSLSKAILLFLMVAGACAGSTGGGMKCGRIVLLFKSLRRSIRQTLYPNRVLTVHMNGAAVEEKILRGVHGYLTAYAAILLVSFLVISVDGFSTGTNLSAVLACFNNIGPGLEAVGPTCNYAGYSALSKVMLIADMLAGRLEIFPILVLASPTLWKR